MRQLVIISLLLLASPSLMAATWHYQSITPTLRLITSEVNDPAWSAAMTNASAEFASWFNEPTPLDIVVAAEAEQLQDLPEDLAERRLSFSLAALAEKSSDYSSVAGILAHEACHLWLIDYLVAQGMAQPQTQIPAYGHGDIADWLDETIAVACEPPELADQRRNKTFELIKLEIFLTQTHPVYAQLQARIEALLAARQASGQTGQQTIRLSMDESSLIEFYYQAAWFGDFIKTRLPSPQLKTLVDVATIGTEPTEIARLLGAESLVQLEQEFIDFIATHSAE